MEPEIKTEDGWSVLGPSASPHTSEISSDDDSESCESTSCADTSGEDEPIDLDEEPHCDLKASHGPIAVEPSTMVKNSKTKIIHECRMDLGLDCQNAQTFKEKVIGEVTKCGKMVTTHYAFVGAPVVWTAKSRICFHGRRAP